MATYLKNTPVSLVKEYNIDTTDHLVDFIVAEVNDNDKVSISVEVVLPEISGTDDWALYVGADTPNWLTGVTAYDEQQGNLTSDLAVDDSDVDLTAPGTYDLVYTVSDIDGNEEEVTVEVVVTYEIFDITYNLDGGTNSELNPDTFIETDLDITLEDAAKEGYTFTNWHDADTLDSIVTQVTEAADAEVWAEFTAIDYDITYNLDGGANHIDNPATFTIEDLDVTLEDATKEGYTFVAWHDAVTLDSPITDITTIGDKEVWAEWVLTE